MNKPLCFLDLETTGTDAVKDRIVSISAVVNQGSGDLWLEQLINPGVPIPVDVSAIHGITDEMVKDAPSFADDLAGYNLLNFDLPMLWEEFHRVGMKFDLTGVNVVDPCVIFREREPRDLTAAMKFYCGLTHDGAHNAREDVEATRVVLAGQLAKYPDLLAMPREQLAAFCNADRRVDLAGCIKLNEAGVPCYTAKKVRGVPVVNDRGFGTWMLRNEFSEETKQHIRRILGIQELGI